MNAQLDNDQLLSFYAKVQRFALVSEREVYEDSLSEFVRAAWPSIDRSEYSSSWVIDAMCDHLEAVTLGQISRLLINVPPRCSKTSVTSICWPAWTWARSQQSFWSGAGVRFLCASYSNTLTQLASTAHRRLIDSPWYAERWGERFGIKDDQDNKTRFDTTKGGYRQSTSVGGGLLGLGGDVIIVDDPHNTETEKVVETDADRIKVASFWRELSGTRLNDQKKTAIVVNMQRLHQGDLSGIILEEDEEDWVHLMIPMEHDPLRHCVTVKLPQYEDDRPWEDPRTEEDELMWEERFGPKEVKRQKAKLGPYMASGRLQQSPVPKGGAIIQRNWWQLWGEDEARRYNLEWTPTRKEFPPFELVVGSVDTAYKEKEENDFNAMTVWGLWQDVAKNPRAMLMFAWAKRVKLNGELLTPRPGEAKATFMERQKAEWGLVEWIADTCKRYKVKRLLIEDKARGHDVANELEKQAKREKWGIEMIEPQGDKVARTHAVVSMFADRAIWSPDTRWAETVISQCELFPKGDFDDLHDTVTQFLKWSRDNNLLLRGEEVTAAMEDEALFQHQSRSVADAYGV